MPVAEAVALRVAVAVLSFLSKTARVEDRIREKLGRDPVKRAFAGALARATEQLDERYPDLAATLFDGSFLEHEGAPILAELLVRDGRPDPTELAKRWAGSINAQPGTHTTVLIRQAEEPAAYLLDTLATELSRESELQPLHDSRALERIADSLEGLRTKLNADESTAGSRLDYLAWITGRNSYIDPRGIPQTQRQVQLPLSEVYVTLTALHEANTPAVIDRPVAVDSPDTLQTAHGQPLRRGARHTRFAPGEDDEITLEAAALATDYSVILGDPGAGKTTLLRYLALKHGQALFAARDEVEGIGRPRFPIYVRIAEYAGSWRRASLTDRLADLHRLHECPVESIDHLLGQELLTGGCVVLLDGLDEVVDRDDRSGVVHRIEEFVRRWGQRGNQFVITSRVAGYRDVPLADPFVHFRVRDMSREQVQQFLERWCPAVEKAQAPEAPESERRMRAQAEIDGITTAIERSEGVKRLAANPLLLTILALIHRTGAQLPQKRIELYKTAADTLARTWRTAQGVPESALVDPTHLTRLLGKVAYWLHATESSGIADEREIAAQLGDEWARITGDTWDPNEPSPRIAVEVRDFLATVRVHTGLLLERAPRRYGFMHLTFEEYFAARHLIARPRAAAELIRQHLHDPRWEEPILLALGFVGLDYPEEASDLVETAILGNSERSSAAEDLLGRDFLFALRCLGDQIPVERTTRTKLLRQLCDELLEESGRGRFQPYRALLIERLEQLSGTDAGDEIEALLIEALSVGSVPERIRTAEALEQLQLQELSLTRLVDALSDADENVRTAAGDAMSHGRRGPLPDGVRAELERLVSSRDVGLAREAARVLAAAGHVSPEVADVLADAVLAAPAYDEDRSAYRRTLDFAFALAGNDLDVPEVARALVTVATRTNEDFTWAVSDPITSAMRDIPSVVQMLEESLSSSPPQGQLEALRLLWGVRDPSSEELDVFEELTRNADPQIREGVAGLPELLDEGCPARLTTALRELLDDEEPTVQEAAAEGLIELGDGSVEMVRRYLTATARIRANESPSPPHVYMPAPGRSALTTLVSDSEAEIRLLALAGINDVREEIDSDLVAPALRDPVGSVRAEAIRVLAQHGGHAVLDPEIEELLDHEDAEVRCEAAFAYHASTSELPSDVATALVTALHDNDPEVRARAAVTLLRSGLETDETVALVGEALGTTPSWRVREGAAAALAQVRAHRGDAISALVQALTDEDYDVNEEAARSLARIGRDDSDSRTDVETALRAALTSDRFAVPHPHTEERGYDAAWRALWMLVTGTESG